MKKELESIQIDLGDHHYRVILRDFASAHYADEVAHRVREAMEAFHGDELRRYRDQTVAVHMALREVMRKLGPEAAMVITRSLLEHNAQ